MNVVVIIFNYLLNFPLANDSFFVFQPLIKECYNYFPLLTFKGMNIN